MKCLYTCWTFSSTAPAGSSDAREGLTQPPSLLSYHSWTFFFFCTVPVQFSWMELYCFLWIAKVAVYFVILHDHFLCFSRVFWAIYSWSFVAYKEGTFNDAYVFPNIDALASYPFFT